VDPIAKTSSHVTGRPFTMKSWGGSITEPSGFRCLRTIPFALPLALVEPLFVVIET